MERNEHRLTDGFCAGCGAKNVKPMGVEYAGEMRERYDGVSEWVCPYCGRREGRWTGRVLTGKDLEPRFGHPRDRPHPAFE